MRPIGWIALATFIILIVLGYFLFSKIQILKPSQPTIISTPSIIIKEKTIVQQKNIPLAITSPVFEMNGLIPSRFTCDGENISPELIFSNVPKGTQSFALIMEDPDVPKTVRADGMWNHWLVWNIPPQITRIKEGETPLGIIGANTGGKMKYAGPCPPDREHRYIFTLYALDSLLSLPNSATKEELLQALSPHLIEQAKLIGRYNRK